MYKITYRHIDSMTNYDISCIKKLKPEFCMIKPIIANYTMGEETGIILTDGEHALHFTEDQFKVRMKASKAIKPSDRTREIVHKEIFNID